MKKGIAEALLAAVLLLSLWGCEASGSDIETKAPEAGESAEAFDETSGTAEDGTDEAKFFDLSEAEGGYTYNLYNRDGSVAEEAVFVEEKPSCELLFDSILKITVGDEVYYYHLEKRAFSETYTGVFSENGTMMVREEDNSLVVSQIFDSEGMYTVISEFSYELYTAEGTPFVEVKFSDDGQSIKCVYLSGSEKEEMTEYFNITDKTRFTVVDDWINKKDLISGPEKESVIGFLCGYMGTVDYNTGFDYAYEVSGSLVINGQRYYHCECFYVMEKDDGTVEKVPCAEFVISDSYGHRYDCREDDGGGLVVYTENNMI